MSKRATPTINWILAKAILASCLFLWISTAHPEMSSSLSNYETYVKWDLNCDASTDDDSSAESLEGVWYDFAAIQELFNSSGGCGDAIESVNIGKTLLEALDLQTDLCPEFTGKDQFSKIEAWKNGCYQNWRTANKKNCPTSPDRVHCSEWSYHQCCKGFRQQDSTAMVVVLNTKHGKKTPGGVNGYYIEYDSSRITNVMLNGARYPSKKLIPATTQKAFSYAITFTYTRHKQRGRAYRFTSMKAANSDTLKAFKLSKIN